MILFFTHGTNGLRLLLESLSKLESEYNQLIAARLSTGLYNTKVTPNVILFLVEGLDSHTMSAARKLMADTTPVNAMNSLDSFVTGYIKPHSRDHMVADPAAASSSIFTGLPERNGQMGWVLQENNTCLQRDPNIKVAHLFKRMSMAGKYTALVTTAPLTSPGVAGTYASVPDMKLESDIHLKEAGCDKFSDIAKQLILDNKKINVIIGTGRNYFHKNSTVDELTGGTVPDARADMDLKKTWEFGKILTTRNYKVAFGKANVSDALTNDTLDYILGFLEEKDDIELTSSNLKSIINSFKKKPNSRNGYFITVYIDQIARAHDSSQAVKAAKYLDQILGIVKDIHGLVKDDDTLLIVSSTQGSTLTVGSGAILNEKLDSFTKTEDCVPYTFLNYAFGQTNSTNFSAETGGPDFRFPSPVFNPRDYKRPDLPIFASGKTAGLFTGVNEFPYIYHAILGATCLTKNAYELYDHCRPPVTTTTAATPTTPAATTTAAAPFSPASSATPTTAVPATTPTAWPLTKPPVRPHGWPWYIIQPLAANGPNPYANYIRPYKYESSNVVKPNTVNGNPEPTPAPPNGNGVFGSSPWSWSSFFPFFF
ncbi:hypothetical protein Btru_030329 [Bulinus truncatus]|nr:hypothetical protein Btru_030329 [Bulinus truncatus]